MNKFWVRFFFIFIGVVLILSVFFPFVQALQIGGTSGGNCGNLFCDLKDDVIYWGNLLNVPVYITNWAHDSLNNLGWSVSGHFFDSNVDLNTFSIYNVGDVNATRFIGDGSLLTGISTTDTNFETAGYGDLNMDLNYLQSGDNISELFNDAGYLTNFNDTNAWTAGIINDSNVFLIDLNSVGNLKADGNYLCDSVDCYLISDLNISSSASTDDWNIVMSRGNQSDYNAIIDINSNEALLVRKDSDGGDVFIVDTTNERVGVGVTPSHPFHIRNAPVVTPVGNKYTLYNYSTYTADPNSISGATLHGAYTYALQNYSVNSAVGQNIYTYGSYNEAQTYVDATSIVNSDTIGLWNKSTVANINRNASTRTYNTYGIRNEAIDASTMNNASGAINSNVYGNSSTITLFAARTAGNLIQNSYGNYIYVTESSLNAANAGTIYGEYINIGPKSGSALTAYNIFVSSTNTATKNLLGKDNVKTFFGTGIDASIYYDGTNLIVNPKEVGSGALYLAGNLELGHATDTTIARVSAGVISVEGKNVYMAGGTDVAVADGGTGRSSHTAYALLAGGTTATAAQQSVANSSSVGAFLYSQGTSVLPTYTGAPFVYVPSTESISFNSNLATARSAIYNAWSNSTAVSGSANYLDTFYGLQTPFSINKAFSTSGFVLGTYYLNQGSFVDQSTYSGTPVLLSNSMFGNSFSITDRGNYTANFNSSNTYNAMYFPVTVNTTMNAAGRTKTSSASGIVSIINENHVVTAGTVNSTVIGSDVGVNLYNTGAGTLNSEVYGLRVAVAENALNVRNNQVIYGLYVNVSSGRSGSALKGIVLPRDGAGGDIYMGASNDFYLTYDGTNGYIQTITGKIVLSTADGSSVQIGGGADKNYSLLFDGDNSDVKLTWFKDENYLDINSSVKIKDDLNIDGNVYYKMPHLFGIADSTQAPTAINTWKAVDFNFLLGDAYGFSPQDSNCIVVHQTGHYFASFELQFEDSSPTPTSSVGVRISQNGSEVAGSYSEIDMVKQDGSQEITTLSYIEANEGDVLCMEWITSDIDVNLQTNNTWADQNTTAKGFINWVHPDGM